MSAVRVAYSRDTLYSNVYESDVQDFLSSSIAHGVCIGAERKVARVDDTRVLREVLDRVESRAETLARGNSWVLEYNFPLVVFWESAHPPSVS